MALRVCIIYTYLCMHIYKCLVNDQTVSSVTLVMYNSHYLSIYSVLHIQIMPLKINSRHKSIDISQAIVGTKRMSVDVLRKSSIIMYDLLLHY